MSRWLSFPLLVTLVSLPTIANAEVTGEEASPEDPAAAPAAEPAPATDRPPPPPAPSAPAAPPPATDGAVAPPPGATPIVVTTPPPPPIEEKVSRRVHEGIYVRLSLGSGAVTTLFSEGLLAQRRVSGTGGAFDVQLGGTPAKGLVLGGGLFMNSLMSSAVRRVGHEPDDEYASVGILALGPFLDYFPDPKRGLHFGGMVGLAAMHLDTPGFASDQERLAGGGAVGLWLGHDWWIARKWSLGVSFRYLGVRTENEDEGWTGAADSFTLAFTALAH